MRMRKLKSKAKLHEPVLKEEVLEALKLKKIAHLKRRPRIIDATLGLGGHTLAIVKAGGNVLGIEADSEMLEIATVELGEALGARGSSGPEACPPRLSRKAGSFKLVHGNFRDIDRLAEGTGFDQVNGIVFDLGVSLDQLASPIRGFSFRNPKAKLDMRIDKSSQAVSAADLLNSLRERELNGLFQRALDRNEARRIAELVVKKRTVSPIETVGDFLDVCKDARPKRTKLHPATRAFLALRMAVNSELPDLNEALPKAFSLLSGGGRLIVISFHSEEDREVKAFFRKMQEQDCARIVGKPVVAGEEEIEANPRARSAKMRVLEKP